MKSPLCWNRVFKGKKKKKKACVTLQGGTHCNKIIIFIITSPSAPRRHTSTPSPAGSLSSISLQEIMRIPIRHAENSSRKSFVCYIISILVALTVQLLWLTRCVVSCFAFCNRETTMQTEDFKFLYKELMTTPGTTIFQKFISKEDHTHNDDQLNKT